MRITDVSARVLRIPRSNRLTTSYGSEDNATTILVEIRTDEGVAGIGQASVDAPFYGESAEGMMANIQAHLGPSLVGMNPLATTACRQAMQRALPHHEFSHSCVDMALLDLKGKALGVPMYDLFGGKVRDGLTLMGFVHHGTPDAMAETALRVLDEHAYKVLKMKIGLDPVEDVARYRAVAEAIDGRALMQVDGNTGYELWQALWALGEMEAIGGLGCIEQPVPSMHDMAILARRLKTPIMADEAIYAPSDAVDVIREEAASIALLKMNKHGGPSAVREIGTIFGAANLTLSIAIYYDLIGVAAAHLAAAIPCVTWPSPATDLADTFVGPSFAPDGLTLAAPEGPGLGVELDWDKIERYSVPS
jgi:L-alanine-DL-glutamate epimerase-like enolase superfamily enzyme